MTYDPRMTRYWLSHGDGRSYGPYTVEELRAYVAEGRVTASSVLCAEGATEWMPATVLLPALAASVPPPMPGQFVPVEGARHVTLLWSILATLLTFCLACFPFGAVALFYAMRANKRYAMGDEEGGRKAERAHWIWIGVSVVFTLLTMWLMSALWDSLQRSLGL